MVIKITAKCSDLFSMMVEDKNRVLIDYDGYVPEFFPDEHYGDYVMLEINVKTGKIVNWQATEKTVKAWIEKQK